RGSYRPLEVRGERAAHVVAFLREYEQERALVITSRLLASLPERERGAYDWGDTEISVPPELGGLRLRSVLAGGDLSLPVAPLTLKVSEALASLPLALLLSS